ncbi:MAG: cation transporter [Bacteroidia bacterium]
MHDHNHHHHHHHETATGKALWWVLLLNLGFTIIEFVGGYFTGSIAIVSDAFHDLGDSLAILGAIILERIAQRSSNNRYTYGYKRFSILSALGISFILIAGSVYVVYNAIPRLINVEEVNSQGMLWLAVLGVAVNGAAAFKLLKGGKSLNQRALMLHLLEDCLGWVAVLVGAVVIHFTGYHIIDPILSLIIAVYILINAFGSFKKALSIMLQKAPSNINRDEVKAMLAKNAMVKDVHDLHIWTLDGEKNVATLHVRLNGNYKLSEMSELKDELRHSLSHKNVQHVTIEFDAEDADCELEDC